MGYKLFRASEGSQNGGKTTRMDIPEFRDINGPNPMPKNGAIGQIVTCGCESPPPLSLGLRKMYDLFVFLTGDLCNFDPFLTIVQFQYFC